MKNTYEFENLLIAGIGKFCQYCGEGLQRFINIRITKTKFRYDSDTGERKEKHDVFFECPNVHKLFHSSNHTRGNKINTLEKEEVSEYMRNVKINKVKA